MAAHTEDDPPRVAVAPVGVVVVLVGILLVAVNGRYGYHRDELYFIACGRHPAWGYPDQGPVTPLLARFMDDLAPGSPTVLRLPAVASVLGATVLAALIARELGGRGFAQGLTALVVGTGVLTLLGGHLLVTATVDLVVWVAIVYLVVRILAAPPGARDRLWLVVGVVAGIGLLNKALPGVLLLGLLVGGVLTPAVRTRLRSRWLWAGAAVALALWAPYLVWQARNGWPQLELGRMIAREYGTAGQRAGFVVIQLVMFGFAGAYLWISGVSRSLRRRDPRLGPRRPSWQPVLAWAWVVVVAVLAVSAGQGYYGAGIYPPLIAAGAVGLEARLRSTTARALVVGAVVVLAAALAPASLPLLPAHTLQASPWAGDAENQFETIGWPRLVADVAAAYRSLPDADRAAAVLLADNYGEAGAIDLYGPSWGLPRAYSGLNAYGWWGPPPDGGRAVVAVAEDGPPAVLPGCRLVGPVRNDEGVRNEESTSAAVYVCGAPVQGWAAVWPRVRHLSN
ncbi:MAG: glycosyltransferase family 39 protein [Kineosporiaceae bacterium]